jgi:hypothetical protein
LTKIAAVWARKLLKHWFISEAPIFTAKRARIAVHGGHEDSDHNIGPQKLNANFGDFDFGVNVTSLF